MKNKVVLAVSLLCALGVRAAPSLSVVLPAKPSRIETFAAEELRYHLNKAGLGRADVEGEDKLVASGDIRRFFIGATESAKRAGIRVEKLAVEEHLVKGVGRDVYLVGGDRDLVDKSLKMPFVDDGGKFSPGTLYAVYEFLEKTMGVKWLWPGESGEVIPRRDLPKTDGLLLRGREPLVLRRYGGESDTVREPVGDTFYGWADVENARTDIARRKLWLVRNRLGARRKFNGSHAFTDWWRRYGKDHPEYFALLPNGRREALEGDKDGRNTTLCVSNPDLHRQIVANWNGSGSSRTQPYYTACVNACENDTPGMCTCAKCRAWDADDPRFGENPYWRGETKGPFKNAGRFRILSSVLWGEDGKTKVKQGVPSLSDRYVKFYNAILAAAREKVRGAEVFGYAYANYSEPPRETKVADGIIVSYVPRMFFPYTAQDSAAFRSDWGGWRTAGATQMIYRPNYMLAGGNLPICSARRIADDIGFAATNGMIAISQDSLTGVWSAQSLHNYVVTRLMREPTAGFTKLRDEYLSAFGPAAPQIRDYCDLVESVGANLSFDDWQAITVANRSPNGNAGGGFKNFTTVAADLYSEAWFDRTFRCLDAAAATVGGDEGVRRRIAFLRRGVLDAHNTYRTRVAQKSGDQAAFKKALAEMDAYRASVEVEGVCQWYWTATREASGSGWYRDRKADVEIVIPATPTDAERQAAKVLKARLVASGVARCRIEAEYDAGDAKKLYFVGRTKRALKNGLDGKPEGLSVVGPDVFLFGLDIVKVVEAATLPEEAQ